MKNIKYLVTILLITLIYIPNIKAYNIYGKDYETEPVTFNKTNNVALYKMDNLAFKDTNLTIYFTHENELQDSKCLSDYCLVIKQYDSVGKEINELYIQNVYNTISPRVIGDYLYMVNTYYTDSTHYYNAKNETYIEKYDLNLNKINSLLITDDYSSNPINRMFLEAHMECLPERVDGMETSSDYVNCENSMYSQNNFDYYDFYQIHEEDGNIVVYSMEDDYVFDADLKTMTTRANSWLDKYGKKDDDNSYYFIDDKNYLISGYGSDESGEDWFGFLQVYEDGKLVLDYKNEDYYGFYFPIKVNDYYVVLGLDDTDKANILVIDKTGNILQTISGNYWNLRASEDGFVVTNLGTSIYNYFANVSGTESVYTEKYSLRTIKVLDSTNGSATYTRKGDTISLDITPDYGYLVDEIKVTDDKGNVIEVKDDEFIMPDANVTVEVNFIEIFEEEPNEDSTVKNPDTGTISDLIFLNAFFIVTLLITILITSRNNNLFKRI